jgi:quercetin dioxygenase-like cupin family protein
MPFVTLNVTPGREVIPGFTGHFAHLDHLTLSEWEIAEGATLPPHQHPHEQITRLLAGRFEMTVGGETRVLDPGMAALIPAHVPHSARALTACRVLDVFTPVREDYR